MAQSKLEDFIKSLHKYFRSIKQPLYEGSPYTVQIWAFSDLLDDDSTNFFNSLGLDIDKLKNTVFSIECEEDNYAKGLDRNNPLLRATSSIRADFVSGCIRDMSVRYKRRLQRMIEHADVIHERLSVEEKDEDIVTPSAITSALQIQV